MTIWPFFKNISPMSCFFYLIENFLSKLKQLPFDWSKMHNFTSGTDFLYEFIDKIAHLFDNRRIQRGANGKSNLQFFGWICAPSSIPKYVLFQIWVPLMINCSLHPVWKMFRVRTITFTFGIGVGQILSYSTNVDVRKQVSSLSNLQDFNRWSIRNFSLNFYFVFSEHW